jgi:hypothetical protein
MTGGPTAIVDRFGILDDAKIERDLQPSCEVKGLGLGHIHGIKDRIPKGKPGEKSDE